MSNEQLGVHEQDECLDRPVECRLGCGTSGLPLEQGVDMKRSISLHIRPSSGYYIKARDLEHHEKVSPVNSKSFDDRCLTGAMP